MTLAWLEEINWTSDGLVPVIAQDFVTNKILMFAWMNKESLALTVEEGHAVYWSRSRNKLWRKGEVSGHKQKIKSLFMDCDEDVLIIKIEQVGGIACHTGRESCFYRQYIDGKWQPVEPVLQNPETIYKK